MISDLSFIKALSKELNLELHNVRKNDNIFEYMIYSDENSSVFGCIEIENPLTDNEGNVIGYFGINIKDKKVAYYILEDNLNETTKKSND